MAKEIERKFLVDPLKWNGVGKKVFLKQAYLLTDPERTVRVRMFGNDAVLTIKGITRGITRDEFNYSIPESDANELFKLAIDTPIRKIRYLVNHDGKMWEVDVFLDDNEGLILAEIELGSEAEEISLPDWVTKEVSDDNRYYNSYLSKNPFKKWQK